jgi:hypothetical protein
MKYFEKIGYTKTIVKNLKSIIKPHVVRLPNFGSNYDPSINLMNIQRNVKNPIAEFLHESGHALDPLKNRRIRTKFKSFKDEARANRQVKAQIPKKYHKTYERDVKEAFNSYKFNINKPKNTIENDIIEKMNLRTKIKYLKKTQPGWKQEYKANAIKNKKMLSLNVFGK